MSPRSARRAVALCAALSGAIVLATAAGDPSRAAPDRWQAFDAAGLVPALAAIGFFPGWYALSRARRLGTGSRVAFAVVVSALAAFSVGTVVLLAGWPLVVAARALAALTITGAAWSWIGAGRSAAEWPGVRARAGSALVLAWVALVAGLYVANPELRARGDGWFHAAVSARVAQVGIPPDDPWYVGERLHYAWAIHVVVDVLVAASPRSASPLGLLAGWSVLSALATGAALLAAGARWARAAGDGARAGAAAAWTFGLAVLAVHPLGFWWWLAQSQVGDVRGWDEFVRPLGAGAGATLEALSHGLPHASLAFFSDKFLIPTAFGFAYAAIVLALDAIFLAPESAEDAARRTGPDRGDTALAASAILAALVFHPFAGAALLAALLAAAGMAFARGRAREAKASLAPAAIAALAAAPYLIAVTLGREPGAGPWLTFAPRMIVVAVVTGLVLLAIAWPELRRAGGVIGERRAALGAIVLVWFAAAVTLGFVQRNETKFINLALLALAIPAGAHAARRPARAALALAIALPTAAMALLGFVRDAGQQSLGARVPPPDAALGYAWIAAHTGPRDAFLEAQPESLRDPVRDLLVLGPRPLVWGGDSYASNWGYSPAELALRRRAAIELAAGDLGAASVRELGRRFSGGGHALFVVERGRDRAPASDKPGAWTRVYEGAAFALDRLDAPPAASDPGSAGAP